MSSGGTPLRGVFRRCLTARTIILCAFIGLVFTALTDLGIRWRSAPGKSLESWILRPHSELLVVVTRKDQQFRAMTLYSTWYEVLYFYARDSDHHDLWRAVPAPAAMPGWSYFDALARWRQDDDPLYEGFAFGFPLRSSTQESIFNMARAPTDPNVGGLGRVGLDPIYMVTDPPDFATKSTRIFTLGVLANTVAWSCVAFGAWTAVTWWRVRRRHRRGVCEHCGYDLRGLVKPAADSGGSAKCPECGNAGPVRG